MQHLVLLHGAIGARDQLQRLAGSLKERYIIHSLNFNGHGGVPFANKGFSIPVFASEVLSYLQQQEIDKTNIFGYSMGGFVAMYLAKQHPGIVDKIITLATKYYWDEAVAAKEVKMLDADTILQKIPAFAEQLEKRHYPYDWKDVLLRTKDMLIQLGNQNSLQPADYKTINSACLLLLGDKDKMVTAEETMAVQKALPNAAFRLLPDTPHPIEQVDHQMLASIIDEFISPGS